MTKYDVVVIGAGPGGYTAAIRAAQLNQSVALIDKSSALGGVCLNWGCIPTKALLKSAEVYNSIKEAEIFGINVGECTFDFQKIIQRSRDVVSKLNSGIEYLMKKNKIKVYTGFAKLAGNGVIAIDDSETISAKKIIIATGARPRNLPDFQVDGRLIWDSSSAMLPNTLPKSLLIIGSGAIGIEFASFYSALGVEVTIVELQGRILMSEDEEISKLSREIFEKQGIKIYTEASAKLLKKESNSVKISITYNGDEIASEFERVMLATGVVPNVEGMGLEALQIKTDKMGFIITDEWSQTSEPKVYAIGDVAGGACLAHKASHEGVICVEKMLGKVAHALKKSNIPGCIYSSPQIASVGMTEAEAKDAGYEIKVGRFRVAANGKAIALNESMGIVKTVIDARTGELLGAHMIGAEVTEMINGFVIARALEATDLELRGVIFPHPTLSEMMHESILDADKEAINS